MAVNLKTLLQNSQFSSAEQREILKQDLDHNGSLDESDLVPRFGKTAAKRFMSDLESSLLQNRFSSFIGTLGKLEEARRLLFAQGFSASFQERKGELASFGVSFEGNKMNFAGLNPSNKVKVREILVELLLKTYSTEFQSLSPSQQEQISFRVDEWMRGAGRLDSINSKTTHYGMNELAEHVLQKESFYWNPQVFVGELQEEYADIQYHEIHPLPELVKLENKYGIDLRVRDGELKVQELKILDQVLEKIYILRPQDLRSIPSITLFLGPERSGGMTYLEKGGAIHLYGPFGQAVFDPKLAVGYAQDLQESFSKDAETYLCQTLLHEMGHRQENETSTLFYKGLFPGKEQRVLEELMAEDYRSFFFSRGTEVSQLFADGREIGKQVERLNWVKSRYPIK